MSPQCDYGCGRVAKFRWEGKRVCWPCKKPLLLAASKVALHTLANDKRFADHLSKVVGVTVKIEARIADPSSSEDETKP